MMFRRWLQCGLSAVLIFYFAGCPFVSEAAQNQRLPLAAGIIVNKARVLAEDGRIQEAIQTIERYIKKQQSHTPPKKVHFYLPFILGNYYSALLEQHPGDHIKLNMKIAQCYKAALAVNPKFSPAWLNLAKCSYETEQYAEAARSFENGYLTSDQKNASHLYYAAVCHFQSGGSQKALTLFNTLLADHPEDVSLVWKEMLVNILFSLDQHPEALVYIEELAEKFSPPKQKKWQEILLHQYLVLEMNAKALSYAHYLTKADPLEAKWWKALSSVYLNTGTKEASQLNGLAALVVYGFLTPMSAEELLLAADLYLTLDVPVKAIELYHQRLDRVMDGPTLDKLSQAFIMAHDPDSAVQWIEKGLSSIPGLEKHHSLVMRKAQLLYMQKSWSKAAGAYQQVAQLSETGKQEGSLASPGHAWLMSGYSYLNNKDYDKAENAFKKAARFKQHKPKALKALKQLEALNVNANGTHSRQQ